MNAIFKEINERLRDVKQKLDQGQLAQTYEEVRKFVFNDLGDLLEKISTIDFEIHGGPSKPGSRYILFIKEKWNQDVCMPKGGLCAASFSHLGNPNKSFEYFRFEYKDVDIVNDLDKHFKKHKTHAFPVSILEKSNGLEGAGIVALFPEDFYFPKNKSKEDLDDQPVFFFMDRFVERFDMYSRDALDHLIEDGTFEALKQEVNGNKNWDVERRCAEWMKLHESGHRHHTNLPLLVDEHGNDHRKFKDTLFAQAFEEMRADISSLQTLVENNEQDDYSLLIEFVMLERLMRYPIQCLIEGPIRGEILNYDAIGSQMLLNFLLKNNYAEIIDNKLHLKDDWTRCFANYLKITKDEEEKVSSFVKTLSPESQVLSHDQLAAGKRRLEEFAHELSGFRGQPTLQEIHPFYRHGCKLIQEQI